MAKKQTQTARKQCLLYGPPGVGKTALVNAAAKEFGFTIIEMNASDTRSEKAINAVAKPATSYVALDNFSGQSQKVRETFFSSTKSTASQATKTEAA